MVDTRSQVLVTVAELAALLDGGSPPVVLDVRWALGDPDGRQHYLDGHIPGARFVDLDTELAAISVPTAGRHPLPSLAVLTEAARSWGVRSDSTLVFYDNTGGLAAGRGWWLLRWAGLSDVRLLDGGLRAWTEAGFAVEAGDSGPVERGDVVLTEGGLPTMDADGAAGFPSKGVLLDARPAERYRGEVEPVDPRKGHIPGAVSVPTTTNLGPDGTFLPADELRAKYAALGVTPDSGPVGVYCGSGVTASHEVAALASIGVEAVLYPASYSSWSWDPERPVVVGEAP